MTASPPQSNTPAERRHSHGRAVSHPLPRIFSRKKSARNLPGFNPTDVPLDDTLVPVLDEAAATKPVPTRVISGRQAGARVGEDEKDKVARRCMCCDSKVSVPKELDKFRCLACLTINDLKPADEQRDDAREEQNTGKAHGDIVPADLPVALTGLQLSLERTKAIIDQCLMTYLEARCKRQAPPASRLPGLRNDAPLSPEKRSPTHTSPVQSSQSGRRNKQLMDAPLSSSPPDAPCMEDLIDAPSATIRSPADIDHFTFIRTDEPRPAQQASAQEYAPPNSGSPSKAEPTGPPNRPRRKPPPPPVNVGRRIPSGRMLQNSVIASHGPGSPTPALSPRPTPAELKQRDRYERVKTIFRPLEDYMLATFGDYQCLNSSFSTARPVAPGRARSESNVPTVAATEPPLTADGQCQAAGLFEGFSELDAKTLLLGNLGENSLWWTGKQDKLQPEKSITRKKVGEASKKAVSSRSPNINWIDLKRWYEAIHTAGENWQVKVEGIVLEEPHLSKSNLEGLANIHSIDEDLEEAREHAVRALLKITENILKRPSRPLREPENLRFLLIILANPSLYPSSNKPRRADSGTSNHLGRTESEQRDGAIPQSPKHTSPTKSPGLEGSQHPGILKRVFGLLANSSDNCHRYLITWLARFDEAHFVRTVDLVASFVTHRIARRSSSRPRSRSGVNDGGLIPDLSGGAMNTSAQLHSAMGLSGSVKKRTNDTDQAETDWSLDWQTKAAAKLMSLIFTANNIWQGKREAGSTRQELYRVPALRTTPDAKARRSGQLLHTSTFYNTLLDYHDMITDFKVWESKRDKFAFCQYPLFLSMGAKIKVLEYDARRQMENKAREAYFDQVIRQRAIDGYFHLRVRRECMVDDSLRQISEAVGAGQEELKKGLRVHFTGEEGVDAGGPRKEWFLMLVRDIFDPNHGMFVYDDDSHTCYFNPNSFETSDQYYLVGALLGLAIYNSTILDVAFPPFAFRKLLAAAPSTSPSTSSVTGSKGQMTYTLADLAEFRPSLAAGLQQLLDFQGDVETTYCRDFVATVERYGTLTDIPLISNGEGTPVTNANRQEFVDAYIRYLLDTSVARQFEPFKRGFFTVCAGNALSLFRAEEIELLVRGSDEALDVDSLRAVAVYENWRHPLLPHHSIAQPADNVEVIQWFWDAFKHASVARQRKLLTFITGTDRIPAVGATSLVLRIVAGGDGWGGGGKEERRRFPVARTCFNMLVLWRYDDREQLEQKLWRAVEESEGFGLK